MVLRAVCLVTHNLSGILMISSPSLISRRANNPRPELSLVISSFVSVLIANGCGASPQLDISDK